jgi:hypothetical protein
MLHLHARPGPSDSALSLPLASQPLAQLRFYGNPIGAGGAGGLTPSDHLGKLVWLSLDDNAVHEATWKQILYCPDG